MGFGSKSPPPPPPSAELVGVEWWLVGAIVCGHAAIFALCYLIFGGGDDGEAARAEIARERAEAAARHAENAATAAEIAERATRGEVRGGDPYACPVRVPESMRYWTRTTVQELPGDAPE